MIEAAVLDLMHFYFIVLNETYNKATNDVNAAPGEVQEKMFISNFMSPRPKCKVFIINHFHA